jgi:hypothetical protein
MRFVIATTGCFSLHKIGGEKNSVKKKLASDLVL